MIESTRGDVTQSAGVPPLPPPCLEVPGYEILGELGKGGMGVVYKARNVRLNRVVAVKVMLTGPHTAPEHFTRFRAEAEALARLDHPNVVAIYEVGEHDGVPFYVMECLGGRLRDRTADGPLPPTDAARCILPLARALQHAHERGVIHRDVSPANVLLAPDGSPKLTDFGLAKWLDAPGPTVTGAILGTPSYLAPEQARGESKRVGAAADVYSLGAVLYECLTGRPPFLGANTAETLLQVLTQEPVPVRRLQPACPRDLETICLKCLEKDPVRRYPSAAALADDLTAFADGRPIHARPVGPLGRLLRWCRRNPTVATLTAAVGLLLVAVAVVSAVQAVRLDAARLDAVHSAANEHQQREAAEAAADRERLARAEAVAERTRAETALYFSRVSLAAGYWAAGNVTLAEQNLEECPPDLTHWEWRYLKSLCRSDLATVPAPAAAGTAVVFAPDGRRSAAAVLVEHGGPLNGPAWFIEIRDTASGSVLHKLKDDSEGRALHGLAFGPDGKQLAVALDGVGVRLWEVERGVALLRPRPAKGAGVAVAFGPDGKRVAWTGQDGTLNLVEVATGRTVSVASGHVPTAHALAFAADGARLATAGRDDVVRIWDVVDRVRELRSLPGHAGGTLAVAFSPDGARLATAGRDDVVRLWDADGKELLALRDHAGPVGHVAFTPDGRLVTGGADRTVRVWDAATGRPRFVLRGHAGAIRGLGCAAVGERLLSAGADGVIKSWDARTGRQGLLLPGGRAGVAFSPDGRHVATASITAGSVTVWDAATGREAFTLAGHTGPVFRIAYGADGSTLVSAAAAGGGKAVEVKVWDPTRRKLLTTVTRPAAAVFAAVSADGQLLGLPGKEYRGAVWDVGGRHLLDLAEETRGCGPMAFSPDGREVAAVIPVPGFDLLGVGDNVIEVLSAREGEARVACLGQLGRVHALAFAPSGRHLAAAGADEVVRVWDVTEDASPLRTQRRPLLTLRGHTRPVRALAFSPDGRRLVSVSCDDSREEGEVKLWDVPSGGEVLTLPRPGRDLAFSADGNRLAVCASDGTVHVWDGPPVRERLVRSGAGSWVALSPDGTTLATTGMGEAVQLWEARSGRPGRRLAGLAEGNPDGHARTVHRAVFSRDGLFIATGGADKIIKLWDARTGNFLRNLEGHTDAVADLAFAPDGARLASAGADDTVRVWDARTGAAVAVLKGHTDRVLAIAFGPRGRLVSGGDDKALILWTTADGAGQPTHLPDQAAAVNAVAFSSDGARLASADEDGTVVVWDAAGERQWVRAAHPGGIRQVAFAPDGRRLATAGWDGVVKLWDATTGRELAAYDGHTGGVTSVALGERLLVSADADRTVRAWSLPPIP